METEKEWVYQPPATSRIPPEESVDLYPGLCIHDTRVGGSATVSQSRLPIWTFIIVALENGWDAVVKAFDHIETEYDWTRSHMATFLYYLMQPRGELARLVLADAERESSSNDESSWYERAEMRGVVREQLNRCIGVFDRMDAASNTAQK